MTTQARWRVSAQHATLRVTAGSHFAYYALVAVQADHGYRYAAGALFIMLVVEWVLDKGRVEETGHD